MSMVNRRSFLRTLSGGAAGGMMIAPFLHAQGENTPGAPPRLLDEIERRACTYFFDQADPESGLVLDRAAIHMGYVPAASSIAATGFGLSAMCIADDRGYLDRPVAQERVLRTLRFLRDKAAQE